jgi:ABC-type Fe3+-hydroxamate transport system substrate-binding protein
MRRRLFLYILTAVAACVLTACDAKTVNPGRSAAPAGARQENRIVVLSPALGVILRDLGLEDAIVGRHAWDMALGDSIPVVGTHDDPDLESILRLEPTHIIVQDMEAKVPESLRRLAAERGWLVWGFPLLTLDDIALCTDELHMRLVDEPEPDPSRLDLTNLDPTDRLARERPSARLADAWSDRGASARSAGRVLLLASVDPAGAMGPGSFHHQLIERLGATPAITTGGPWQELDHEDILRLAPDAIILFRPRAADAHAVGEPELMSQAESLGALGGIAGLDIPAVREGRVGVVEHPLGLIPASSLAEVADELAGLFAGWAGTP